MTKFESEMMRERVNVLAHDLSNDLTTVLLHCSRMRVLCPPTTADEEEELRDLEEACDRVYKKCHQLKKL